MCKHTTIKTYIPTLTNQHECKHEHARMDRTCIINTDACKQQYGCTKTNSPTCNHQHALACITSLKNTQLNNHQKSTHQKARIHMHTATSMSAPIRPKMQHKVQPFFLHKLIIFSIIYNFATYIHIWKMLGKD